MKEKTVSNNNIEKDFDIIIENAHFWNWQADWILLKDIYNKFPNSYSILIPFAYSYLEECIRSTTTQYGREILDENGNEKYRKTGNNLISLAIKENTEEEYIELLKELREYFKPSKSIDKGDNRNGVLHGYLHSAFWEKEVFEKLIHDIARISKYVQY